MDINKLKKIESAVTLLKLLAHPVRLSILCNLLHRGEMNVTELVEAEEGSVGQSQISQYLGKMRSEGLVRSRKQAQVVYYQIESKEAKKIIEALYEMYCGPFFNG